MYEDYIAEFEDAQLPSDEALEAAEDAMSFVLMLHTLLRENGANLSEEPNVDELGNVIDGVFGELAAASIFLSEKVFQRVPKMLRGIADAIETADVDFEDPNGEIGPSVPPSVIRGYRDLAKRIEVARVQKAELFETLKKVTQNT